MGTGHRQHTFFKIHHQDRYSHGGILRNRRRGRGARPLATKEALHVVFKIDKSRLKRQGLRTSICFVIVNDIIKTYAKMFSVKIEQLSIQNDHIHILIRTHRRSLFHHFFRVVSGQIAQRFEKTGLLAVTDTPANSRKVPSLWKHRPFSRVVKGWKAFTRARNYVRLNEMEALGKIPYRKSRLKGLSAGEWAILWK